MALMGDKKKYGNKVYVLKDIRFRKSDAERSRLKYKAGGGLVRVEVKKNVLSHKRLYLIWVR